MSAYITIETRDALNRLRKNVPSRERAEEVRRIGLSLDGDDARLLEEVAEFLLDARQTLRGGRREVHGGRHWPQDEPHETQS